MKKLNSPDNRKLTRRLRRYPAVVARICTPSLAKNVCCFRRERGEWRSVSQTTSEGPKEERKKTEDQDGSPGYASVHLLFWVRG